MVEALGDDLPEGDVSQADIDRLNSLTADLQAVVEQVWATATAAQVGIALLSNVGQSTIDAATFNPTLTIPNSPTGLIVLRAPEGAHGEDYRLRGASGRVYSVSNGGIKLQGITGGFDYWERSFSFANDFAPGQTLTLQHHDVIAHTRYLGALVKERVVELITEFLLPDASLGTPGQRVAVNATRTGFELVNPAASGGGSGGVPTQILQTINNLVEKTLDLVITKRPDWVLAAADKAQFTSIARGSTPSQHLSNRQPPTGATGWDNDITLSSTRVLVVRIKDTENLSDYRFLFDQPPGVTLNFSALTQYASDGTWVYYAENTLTNESTGRIRLQHHGVEVTSRFIGDLARDKVIEALGDALSQHTPRRVSSMPASLLP